MARNALVWEGAYLLDASVRECALRLRALAQRFYEGDCHQLGVWLQTVQHVRPHHTAMTIFASESNAGAPGEAGAEVGEGCSPGWLVQWPFPWRRNDAPPG